MNATEENPGFMSTTPIEHVIVLMLENRSFDHLCGYWDRLPRGSGLTGEEFNYVDPTDASTPKIYVHRKKLDPEQRDQPEPGHELENALLQLFGSEEGPDADPAPMSGFVKDYIETLAAEPTADGEEAIDSVEAGKELMGCYDPLSTPVLRTLAEEFVLCDRWFSSLPGPTWPNRYYLHAATSDGIADNKERLPELVPLIFDHLEQAGVPWSVYASEKLTSHVGCALEKFSLLLKPTPHPGPYRKEPYFKDIKDFQRDLTNGELPSYSFLEPIFLSMKEEGGNDEHPQYVGTLDIDLGEYLIAAIYEALRNSRYWEKSLFVVLYDEHGGNFDHVPPPAGVVNPDGKISETPPFDFTRLGVRVPALLISPWLEKGKIDSTTYDHASVAASVKEIFGLPDFLTKRDEAARHFGARDYYLGTARTDTPRTLPVPGDRETYEDYRDLWLGTKRPEELSGAVRDQLESMEGTEINDYQRQLLEFITEDVALLPGPEGAPHPKDLISTTLEAGDRPTQGEAAQLLLEVFGSIDMS
jgi:phospholipase C